MQNQVKFVGQAFLTVANNEFDLGAATTDAQFPASQFLRSMAQLPAAPLGCPWVFKQAFIQAM